MFREQLEEKTERIIISNSIKYFLYIPNDFICFTYIYSFNPPQALGCLGAGTILFFTMRKLRDFKLTCRKQ